MKDIYLDHAATTPILPEVVQAITECLIRDFGNPSSLHRMGIEAEKRMKEAKDQLASFVGVLSEEIVFTSGGTEANNLAVFGSAVKRVREGKHLITTQIEHASVLAAFKQLEQQGYSVTYLPVDSQGVLSLDELKEAITENTVLISIMHVNNEIGTIQPIEKIGSILKNLKKKPYFHVDAIQSLGKIPLRPREWGVDLMSFSGHKHHALKGIGALYIRKNVTLQPQFWGGGQEGGLRSGTQNVPGIVSMGKSLEWIKRHLKEDGSGLSGMKELLLDTLKAALPKMIVHGPDPSMGAPHILNISIPGVRGEVLLHALEEQGVYVSTGSACSSRKQKLSHVHKAIGTDAKAAEGAIRISLSHTTTRDEIGAFVPIMASCVKQLERYSRR